MVFEHLEEEQARRISTGHSIPGRGNKCKGSGRGTCLHRNRIKASRAGMKGARDTVARNEVAEAARGQLLRALQTKVRI